MAGKSARSAAAKKTAAKKPARAAKGSSAAHAATLQARGADAPSASQLIDQRIRDVGGWKGETLARMRALILEAIPEMTEEVKWRKPSNAMAGIPVWSHHGIVCTGEIYTNAVKLTFARGAQAPDPAGLFNASLEGSTRRAIDVYEGETVDEEAFKELVQAAAALNARSAGPAGRPATDKPAAKPRLLAGGNPQIAKGDGDAPVQAYIAAMPGWKRDVGRRLDALISRTVPKAQKAVKWNSPFYGVEGQGWFVSFHCFAKYIKVTFFRGTSLRPAPPVSSKVPAVRYFHIHEHDDLDETQFADWIRQASELPGERM